MHGAQDNPEGRPSVRFSKRAYARYRACIVMLRKLGIEPGEGRISFWSAAALRLEPRAENSKLTNGCQSNRLHFLVFLPFDTLPRGVATFFVEKKMFVELVAEEKMRCLLSIPYAT